MRRGPLRVGDILNSEQLLGREPASFWRENVIADVIPLRVFASMSQW